MEKRINIAIDGYSSCGKSTLARDLARSLDYTYIDSGAMYRAVALYFLRNDIDMTELASVDAALEDIDIDIRYPEGRFAIFLNGENITRKIVHPAVTAVVSEVAAISNVRRKLVYLQQKLGQQKGVVMDGRDIGTVVFPDAEVKLFLTADNDVRAQRRYEELKLKNLDVPIEDVKANLLHRDHIDSTREDSPLRQAEDAILIDNSCLDREEQLMMAKEIVAQKIR